MLVQVLGLIQSARPQPRGNADTENFIFGKQKNWSEYSTIRRALLRYLEYDLKTSFALRWITSSSSSLQIFHPLHP